MKNKKILLLGLVILLVFSIVRFLPHLRIGAVEDRDVYVARVIDGDTIELSNGERLRYIGIDSPELRKKEGEKWIYAPGPYAEESRDFNKRIVEGKGVRLEFDVQKRDKYNRLLAYVYVGDKMVNLEMVREGCAMIYTYPPNVKHTDEFLKAQKYARENKKGFWIDLEKEIISSFDVRENMGLIRMVETKVIETYISESVLVLNCPDNFKVAIFKDSLGYFPKEVSRSPDTYFKDKTIRVYGSIKDYKGSSEIIIHDPSQIEILE